MFGALSMPEQLCQAGGYVDNGEGRSVTSERGSVELDGVTKRFGATTAVDHLDLEIRPR